MSGVDRIAAERDRQIIVEGYTVEQDRRQARELQQAAETYLWANNARHGTHAIEFDEVQEAPPFWPWDDPYWKPTEDELGNLIKAGALIAAAIDAIETSN